MRLISRPDFTKGVELPYMDTEYTMTEDGFVRFGATTKASANYNHSTSYLNIRGLIDNISVFSCTSHVRWDGSSNTVETMNTELGLYEVGKGQVVKLIKQSKSGAYETSWFTIVFYPMMADSEL